MRSRATTFPVTQFPRGHRDRSAITRCLCNCQRLLLRFDMRLDLSQALKGDIVRRFRNRPVRQRLKILCILFANERSAHGKIERELDALL